MEIFSFIGNALIPWILPALTWWGMYWAIRAQRSFEHTVQEPPNFRNYPYPTVSHGMKRRTSLRLEMIQQEKEGSVITSQCLSIIVILTMWCNQPSWQLVQGYLYNWIARQCVLVALWAWYIKSRHSLQTKLHKSASLWLYSLQVRGDYFLRVWTCHTVLVLLDTLLTVVFLRQSAPYALILAGDFSWFPVLKISLLATPLIVCYTLATGLVYFSQHYIPILNRRCAAMLQLCHNQVSSAVVRRSRLVPLGEDFTQVGWDYTKGYTGVAWLHSNYMTERIHYEEEAKRIRSFSNTFTYFSDSDEEDDEGEKTGADTNLFTQERRMYEFIRANLWPARSVILAWAMGSVVSLINEATSHIRFLARSQFTTSLTEGTVTVTGVLVLYYLPPLINELLLSQYMAKAKHYYQQELHLHWEVGIYAKVMLYQRYARVFLARPENVHDMFTYYVERIGNVIQNMANQLFSSCLLLGSIYHLLGMESMVLLAGLMICSWFCFLLERYRQQNFHSSYPDVVQEYVYGVSDRLYNMDDMIELNSQRYESRQMRLMSQLLKSHKRPPTDNGHDEILSYICSSFFYPWALVCIYKLHTGAITKAECLFALSCYEKLSSFCTSFVQTIIFGFMPPHSVSETVKSMQKPATVPDREDAEVLNCKNGGEIVFDRVCYEYPDCPNELLQNISFTIPAHKVTAIVGRSGCGKSTLLNLIMRMSDVTGGRILIDNTDIRHVTQTSLRSQISSVCQSQDLYFGSVYYNVGYGRIASGNLASYEEVSQALEAVNLLDHVKNLDKGLEATVGRSGSLFSGGERQRLLIARALTKNAPILLLDEATSALDTTTETKIMESIKNHYRGCTVVMVAHRLSTVMDADQIVVLDKGKVEEIGTHNELLNRPGGLYAELWKKCLNEDSNDSESGESSDTATGDKATSDNDDSSADEKGGASDTDTMVMDSPKSKDRDKEKLVLGMTHKESETDTQSGFMNGTTPVEVTFDAVEKEGKSETPATADPAPQ
ncbi:mitochondrial ABC iron transporter Atm1 [Dispira parvispora]|uniref:Mitochondrial ABC iron transporter Atm1 n=1 Tax=Dispira parvispora TaxID=1520584 RepID=A0A9W8AYN2_9FUNG|nr:mitochondrial ABC iron transporter Atm1 [Dispira parvispora]